VASQAWPHCPHEGCQQWASSSHTTRGGASVYRCPKGHTWYSEPDLAGPRARTSDPDTSHAAAASMTKGAKRQRDKILRILRERGAMTADELDVALFGGRHTAGRRLCELRDLDLAQRTEEKRDTRSGRKAYLWRLVENEPSLF